jgi:hypothetical protein
MYVKLYEDKILSHTNICQVTVSNTCLRFLYSNKFLFYFHQVLQRSTGRYLQTSQDRSLICLFTFTPNWKQTNFQSLKTSLNNMKIF